MTAPSAVSATPAARISAWVPARRRSVRPSAIPAATKAIHSGKGYAHPTAKKSVSPASPSQIGRASRNGRNQGTTRATDAAIPHSAHAGSASRGRARRKRMP